MKKIRTRLLGTVAALCLGIAVQAAPPTGVWSVDANGFTGTMSILVDAAGNVSGTFLSSPIRGFWTESSQRLMFYRVIGGSVLSTPPQNIQIYTAYQFPALTTQPNGSKRLTGYFEAFGGTGATATRNVFGWYAYK